MSEDAKLTIQMAVDFLNVSQEYVVSLIQHEQIPFHKTGDHCQLYASDVLKYKQKCDTERRAALGELVAQAQELDMGY